MDDVCVVVPMFNEHGVVEEVVTALLGVFPRVICVDDGSIDASGDVARAAGATVLRHPVNLGQGAALRTGITHALRDPRNKFIVTFDADAQHDVRDAVELAVTAMNNNVDVVLGSRFLQESQPIPGPRRFLLRAAVAFTRLTTGLPVTDAHNGLRAFSRSAAETIVIRQPGMAHASEILSEIARLKLSFIERPVSVKYSEFSMAKGQSGINAINVLHELLMAKMRAAS
jgi:glycosyltransferase involved in cell wall biosynthesis